MPRRQIALVCAVAGLTVFGVNFGMYAIKQRFYNHCIPDAYGFSDQCPAQEWTAFGITVACWLVPTYLVARREAIGPFASAFMGSMLWLGIVGFIFLSAVVFPSFSSVGAVSEAWFTIRMGGIMAPVIGLLTAGVGYAMQAVIQARRRKRLSREPVPHEEPAV